MPLARGFQDIVMQKGKTRLGPQGGLCSLPTSWRLPRLSLLLAPSLTGLGRPLLQPSSEVSGCRHRNTWRVPAGADARTCFPRSQQLPDEGGLARGGPHREPAQGFCWTTTLLLTQVLTNVREFKLLKGWPFLPLKQTGPISCCC